MSLNGSGVAVINSAGQPVVATTLITAAAMNALTADLATMISTCIMKDGQQTITADIPFNNNKITGLKLGTVRTDAASLATIQDGTGVYVATVGGTADVITLTPSPVITAYVAGQTFRFLASGANTTTVTVNVSGLGAKAITKNGAVALAAGDLPSGSMVQITYDGTRFILGSPGVVLTDNTFRITGSSDATKLAAFEVDGLTTGTTRTYTLPDRSLTLGPTLATEQATTSGTSIDFTSIPAGVRRLTVMLKGVSTNGVSNLLLQLGDSGGVEITGYLGGGGILTGSESASITGRSTAGFLIPSSGAGVLLHGSITLDLELASAFAWVAKGILHDSAAENLCILAGSKSTSAELDRIRLTTVNGVDTFDAGAMNISYE